MEHAFSDEALAAHERAIKVEALRDHARLARNCWSANKNLRDPSDPDVSYSFDRWLEVCADEIERRVRETVAAELRAALDRHPKVCDRYEEGDVISCGWKSAVRDFTDSAARIARGDKLDKGLT